jgi:hypothetical protein
MLFKEISWFIYEVILLQHFLNVSKVRYFSSSPDNSPVYTNCECSTTHVDCDC